MSNSETPNTPGRTIEQMQKDTDKPKLKSVSQGYLEAMGVPLLSGRTFDGRDSAAAPPSVIINRTVARRFFGDANPVGAELLWASGAFTLPSQRELRS